MHLTFQQLKSALWEAANTLRGSAVDRTDWKGYILPLLFFKRISDVWGEETSDASEIYGDVDPSHFEEVHGFQVPQGCHWTDIRETAANVGDALARAMQEIERANPDTLYRVFGAADWGNREKFADELLKDLIEGVSSISLGNTAVDTDILGDAYEYLVGKFADVTLCSGHDLSALSGLHGAERAPRSLLHFFEMAAVYLAAMGTSHVKAMRQDWQELIGKWLHPAKAPVSERLSFDPLGPWSRSPQRARG